MGIVDTIKNSDYIAPFISIQGQTYGGRDFVDGVVITPLDSNFVAIDQQQVALSGTRMAHMPFEFEGEQRINKTYYAGADEPIIQVLGDSQKDLVLKGAFVDRRYYPDPKFIGSAANENISVGYMNYFEALRKSRQAILISLQDRYSQSDNRFDYIRYAILTKTNFKVKRVSEINYELTFSLMTENKPFYNFFANIPTTNNVLNNAYILGNVAGELEALPDSFPSADTSILGQIKNIISTVTKAIATVTKAIEALSQLTQDIQNSVNKFIGIIDGVLANISSFKTNLTALYSTINSIPDKAKRIVSTAMVAATSSLINKPSALNPASSINTKPYFNTASNQATAKNQVLPDLSLDAICRQLRQQFINSVKKLNIKTHLVIKGDTLQQVSFKEYGDANKWTQLLLYNHLTSTRLIEGKTLMIPNL